MIYLKKLTKEEFGKFLIPNKIFKFEFKKQISNIYEKVKFDKLNPAIFTNIFGISQIIAVILYILSYQQLYINFTEILDSNGLIKFLFISSTYIILSFITYILALITYFIRIESKYRKNEAIIEKDLPEFIDALISNLKGGIPLEKALIKSVRKEQTVLLKEITLINQKIFMGKTALEAIQEFRQRYDSGILGRTIFLIEEGIKSGGNLASPLEKISHNLKQIYSLNEEIKGNASGFALIIRIISIVIAPLLFALAITLLTFIGNLFVLLDDSGTDVLGGSFGDGLSTQYSNYLIIFSYSMIGLITTFSSLITSQLKGERIFVAFKYLPIYVGISMFLYDTFKTLLLGFFGGILG